ncbi:MAG: tetratricopeptide repeat protein [Bryobacteraceae bacterium]
MIVDCFILAVGISVLGEASTIHIKAAVAAYDAAKAALDRKESEAAIKQFRQTAQIEPTFTAAYEGLIRAYLGTGNRLEAGATITQLLEIEPGLNRYRLLLAQILLEQRQPERALAQFSILLKSEPDNADALLGFASAATDMGMEDRASEALDQGRKRYPQDRRFRIAGRVNKCPYKQ